MKQHAIGPGTSCAVSQMSAIGDIRDDPGIDPPLGPDCRGLGR